jgi:iron complex outermembrane recepter protein
VRFQTKALIFGLTLSSLSNPAFAQSENDHHDDDANEIIVTALYARDQNDLLSGTSIVSGDELARDIRPSIGETLTRQAGVSATSFGPNASRPILRGFQGERVRVLSDGIGSFDVSNTSVDHAVVINPLTADRIEVLRGPAALLFGSSAIGGVVNVVDSRIPRKRSDEAVHVDMIGTFGSASSERSVGGRADVAIAGPLVLHLDGSFTETNNLRSGGFLLSPTLRAEARASGDPEIAALADLKGDIPNTAARTWEVAAGLAWISDATNFGVSVSRFDSLYGVPIRFATSAGAAAPEEVRLDVKQTRFDVRGETTLDSGFIEQIKVRGGYADYKHNEIDDTGAIGSSFFNKGAEARFELIQRERNGWKGAIGAQYFQRRLRIVGDEKFLPPSRASQLGLFTVQSLDLGKVRMEAGGRIETSRASAKADVDLGNPDLRRSFTAYSGSFGGNLEVSEGWRVGINASYSERAPSAEELYSNGPHAGTQAFEIGNPAFGKEKSTGLELTLRGDVGPLKVSGSLYKSWFDNFIYEQATGAVEDDLPVFQFLQSKARYAGVELEVSAPLGRISGAEISFDGVGDYTRARIINPGTNQNAPRIPALRLLGGLSATTTHFDLRAEVERINGQKRTAPLETPTTAFTLVNASMTLRPWGMDKKASLILSLNNIFDVTARRHASFLKDYAPLSGRDFRATVRFEF